MQEQVRLQKFLAECGLGSRRKCEKFITEGLVNLNGRTVKELGTKMTPQKDTVHFKGQVVKQSRKTYMLFHKPKDCITTRSDPSGRKTVYDLIPEEYRALHAVGRLDRQTTGLLLFTNDGEVTQAILHPSHKLLKLYEVVIDQPLTEQHGMQMAKGMMLEGRPTMPAKLENIDETHTKWRLGIKEGRNRQIRKMFKQLGYEVVRLQRLQIGELRLGNLKVGACRPLKSWEKVYLQKHQRQSLR
jgi:pseudouridine synthase